MERVGTARLVRRKEIRVELIVYLYHLLAGEAVEGRMTMTLTDTQDLTSRLNDSLPGKLSGSVRGL